MKQTLKQGLGLILAILMLISLVSPAAAVEPIADGATVAVEPTNIATIPRGTWIVIEAGDLGAGNAPHWGTTPPAGWVRHAPATGNITAIRREFGAGTAWSSIPAFPLPTNVPNLLAHHSWTVARPTSGTLTENFVTRATWVRGNNITFNAGTGATWSSIPSGWSGTVGGTTITRTVNSNVNWNTVAWPTASNLSRANHTPTIPTRPTGTVGESPQTSWTATWAYVPAPRSLTFHAGTGATWTSVPSGWTRSADHTQLTRNVNSGVAWSTVAWPTASNLSRANHTPTIPARPTGNVARSGGTVIWTADWMPYPETEITVDVDEEGNVNITVGPEQDYDISVEDGNIVITFPDAEPGDDITVNFPDGDWDYDIGVDEDGNVTVTITPPPGYEVVGTHPELELRPVPEATGGFTVVYNANDGIGTVPVDENTYQRDDVVRTLPSSLTRANHLQVGWRINCPREGAFVALGSTFLIQYHTTLYAEWTFIGLGQ